MSFYRGGAKLNRDSSEPEVIEAFKAGGASVRQISGFGTPDLAVGYLLATHLVEVKTGKAKLRETQQEWQVGWRGEPVVVVRTAEEARSLLRQWEVAASIEHRRKEIP